MQKRTALVPTILCLWLAAGARADNSSRKVAWSEIPPAVRTTLAGQAGSGKTDDLERDEDEDGVSYSATITKDGNESDVTVAEDGRLMSVEVALEDAPAAVQQAIKTELAGGTVDSVEKSFDEDGTVTYDVDTTTPAGADRDFTVALDGKLLSVLAALEELPAAVRKTIDAQVGQDRLEDIYKTFDEGALSYYVEITRAGKHRDFSVAPDGKLESTRVFASELPPLGQKTLHEQIGAGRLIRIDKNLDDSMFHVESRKGGKKFAFKIGPGGRFRGMEE